MRMRPASWVNRTHLAVRSARAAPNSGISLNNYGGFGGGNPSTPALSESDYNEYLSGAHDFRSVIMADIPFPTNLLPTYQSPQAMLAAGANLANTQANTQQIQAQTGLLGAQTAGANIANQGAGLKLGLLQNYYANNQPGASSSPAPDQSPPAETVGGTNFSPDQVSSGIISKFAPLPSAPPVSAVQQDAYAKSIGAPEMAVATYKAQVDKVNQQRQLGANSVYQMAETVASAPAGAGIRNLQPHQPAGGRSTQGRASERRSGSARRRRAPARGAAHYAGIAVHQYTERDTDFHAERRAGR